MGKNLIEIRVPSIRKLTLDQVLSPFFFYQLFCIVVWFLDEYDKFAYMIIFVSIFSVTANVLEKR